MTTYTRGFITSVKVEIVYLKGTCVYGHKMGDNWIVEYTTPAGICNAAYMALYPHIRVLQRGGSFEYPKDSGVTRIGCPDPWNLIVFELSPISGTTHPAVAAPPGSGEIDTL